MGAAIRPGALTVVPESRLVVPADAPGGLASDAVLAAVSETPVEDLRQTRGAVGGRT